MIEPLASRCLFDTKVIFFAISFEILCYKSPVTTSSEHRLRTVNDTPMPSHHNACVKRVPGACTKRRVLSLTHTHNRILYNKQQCLFGRVCRLLLLSNEKLGIVIFVTKAEQSINGFILVIYFFNIVKCARSMWLGAVPVMSIEHCSMRILVLVWYKNCIRTIDLSLTLER